MGLHINHQNYSNRGIIVAIDKDSIWASSFIYTFYMIYHQFALYGIGVKARMELCQYQRAQIYLKVFKSLSSEF